MKYLVKGSIRLVVEADNEKEAQEELIDALSGISDTEPFGEWDNIDTECLALINDDGDLEELT